MIKHTGPPTGVRSAVYTLMAPLVLHLVLVLPQSPASLETWKINVSAWKQSLKRHN